MAERLVPFSKVFQLHLSKNKCSGWTCPRRPPGWAIGLAESLASTSCFPPPSGAGGQPHLSDSYLTSRLQTRVHRRAAEVLLFRTFLKPPTALQSASLRTCLQRLVTHLTKPHFKNICSLFEPQNFKNLLFHNKLCKIIQHTRKFAHL